MTNPGCPNCRTKKSKKILSTKKYGLLICLNCKLGYLDPMPTKNQLQNFYNKDYFESENQEFTRYKNYNQLENVLLKEGQRRLEQIKKLTNFNILLDIGCGLGDFLKLAKNLGYQIAGNDISDYAATIVENKLKIPFYKGKVDKKNLPPEKFEIITAWDVFEHIPDVNSAFEAINCTLKPGGFLFLATPNLKSWDARILGKFWYGYKKIPEHLVFFSPESITNVLEKHHFKVLVIKTWGFERDLEFIITKLNLYIPILTKIVLPVFKFLNLERKSIYLPLTDMFVAAQKIR